MHDINRTQQETGWETGMSDEYAYAYEEEMYPESYDEAYESYETQYGEIAGPLGEAEEMELAAELLGVSNEQELDQFIGKIFNKVKKAVGSVIPPSVRKSLGGMLKGVLPMAGAALGNLALPGIGGMVGGQLASMAGRAFGLELEGLSPEDQEFEIARRYVRLASDAAQEASFAPPSVPPQAAAQQAVRAAAEKHAPGLVAGTAGQPVAGGQQRLGAQINARANGRSGRWVRRGRTLIIYGV